TIDMYRRTVAPAFVTFNRNIRARYAAVTSLPCIGFIPTITSILPLQTRQVINVDWEHTFEIASITYSVGQRICNRSPQSLLLAAGNDGVLLMEDSPRSEEHTSELQSRGHLVCRLL